MPTSPGLALAETGQIECDRAASLSAMAPDLAKFSAHAPPVDHDDRLPGGNPLFEDA